MPETQVMQVGIVGTGYIADFHALALKRVRNAELVTVCDPNFEKAQSFANKWGLHSSYDSLNSMLASHTLDCIHVLSPPDTHHSQAKAALEARVNVLVEKPMSTSVEEADDLCALAHKNQVQLGVTHNMLFAGAYQRLRTIVHSRALGPLQHITINQFLELGQIRSGPFDTWMLRSPGNVILEIGPHLISALLDLAGIPDNISVTADDPVELPNRRVFCRWRVRGSVGRTAVDININLRPGFPQRTISVRGLLGSVLVDFDANTCTFDQRTPLDVDLDRFSRSRSLRQQVCVQSYSTLTDYLFSTLKLRSRGNPYQITFIDCIDAFYSSLHTKTTVDSRISSTTGREVVKLCCKVIETAAFDSTVTNSSRPVNNSIKPTVLVFGGTGFIGRQLVRQLLSANYSVRAVVRHSGSALEQIDNPHLEIVKGRADTKADILKLMNGIQFVYHLALDQGAKTWHEHLRRNVEPTRLIGEACLTAGIKRLIYTGTIDSYYAGGRAGIITEETPLDKNISRRNPYARSKAAAENILVEMHREKHLPVVIFRPGIVIGPGGNPFHFGVGFWASEGVCEVWGDGNNKLPFVLVSDVASALLKGIEIVGIEGRSYNLVDDPLLTARDYLDELQRRAEISVKIYFRLIWRFYLLDLMKWVIKTAVRHPDRSRIPSYSDWESRTQKAQFDNQRARTELGWMPSSNRKDMLEKGVDGSVDSWLNAV
jgi:predicted dehydrogenase/nucleoside-diphosphate-sugar epimerase